AVRYLFAIAGSLSGPVVIDEFPYLSTVSPALPSILQREIDRVASEGTTISLILCGSAMSVMGRLLAGSAPLRGRATLELVIRPFDYRMAARYWNVVDARLAAQVHAIVGGTPAYRRFVSDDVPESVTDFDEWVMRTVLNPANPLFREASYLMEGRSQRSGHRALPLCPRRGRKRQRNSWGNRCVYRSPGCGHRSPPQCAGGLRTVAPGIRCLQVRSIALSGSRSADQFLPGGDASAMGAVGERSCAPGVASRHRTVLGPGTRAALRADVSRIRPGRPGRIVRLPAW
ncbi:MAG: AAA family ATPase, partial [Pseudonocardiaceae bacterium]